MGRIAFPKKRFFWAIYFLSAEQGLAGLPWRIQKIRQDVRMMAETLADLHATHTRLLQINKDKGMANHNILIYIHLKDLRHFWLGCIRMLGHIPLSAQPPNFERLSARLWKCTNVLWACYIGYLDIETVAIERVLPSCWNAPVNMIYSCLFMSSIWCTGTVLRYH